MRHRLPSNGRFRGLRAYVLGRDRRTCQLCGLGEGAESLHNGSVVGLTVTLRTPRASGGNYSPENCRTLCEQCASGLDKVAFIPPPRRIELLRQVRRATVDDQLHLLEWLEKKYANIRPKR